VKYIFILILLFSPVELPDHCKHTRDDFYKDARLLEIRVKNYDKKTGVGSYIFEGQSAAVITFGTFQRTRATWVGAKGIKVGKVYVIVYCINSNHGTGANRRNKNLMLIDRAIEKKRITKQSDPLTQND